MWQREGNNRNIVACVSLTDGKRKRKERKKGTAREEKKGVLIGLCSLIVRLNRRQSNIVVCDGTHNLVGCGSLIKKFNPPGQRFTRDILEQT